MSTVDWSVFLNSSSTINVLEDFASGELSVRELVAQARTESAKREARKLKYIPVRNARRRAREAMRRSGARDDFRRFGGM